MSHEVLSFYATVYNYHSIMIPLDPSNILPVISLCQNETGSKHGGRGDSAVSKGTTDSGVVMEGGEVPVLPGTVPRRLPPLTGVIE